MDNTDNNNPSIKEIKLYNVIELYQSFNSGIYSALSREYVGTFATEEQAKAYIKTLKQNNKYILYTEIKIEEIKFPMSVAHEAIKLAL